MLPFKPKAYAFFFLCYARYKVQKDLRITQSTPNPGSLKTSPVQQVLIPYTGKLMHLVSLTWCLNVRDQCNTLHHCQMIRVPSDYAVTPCLSYISYYSDDSAVSSPMRTEPLCRQWVLDLRIDSNLKTGQGILIFYWMADLSPLFILSWSHFDFLCKKILLLAIIYLAP